MVRVAKGRDAWVERESHGDKASEESFVGSGWKPGIALKQCLCVSHRRA